MRMLPRVIQPPPFAHLLPARSNQPMDESLIDPALRVLAQAGPVGPVNANAVGGSRVAITSGAVNRSLVYDYMVDVTHNYTESVPSRTPGRRDVMRKTQTVKSLRVTGFDAISRVDFINACLSVHELEDSYQASTVRGPGVKIAWTGSSGGKAGARTFETDEEFDLLRKQLLAVDRSSKEVTVFTYFDTEEMDAFKVRKRTRGNDAPPDAKATRIGDDSVKLHAEFIMMLKTTHPCEVHRGEHGEPGYCYVWPDGEHLGLNARRFAAWAAAMAAGEATRHIPPNIPDFDGPQNGGLVVPKSRGRPPARTQALPPSQQSGVDFPSLLMAALVPILASVVNQNNKATASSSSEQPPAATPAGPSTHATSAEQVGAPEIPLSPPSTPNSYIRDCLAAFKLESGIDLVRHEAALAHRDLTPEIIPDVPHDHLASLLGVSEGKTLRYQRFCREWFARQKVKLALQL